MIPAGGEIRCRALAASGPVFAFYQGADGIHASLDQLQIMRDWADGQIKKAMASG